MLFSILFFSSCYNFLLDSKVKQNYICAPEENWIYYTDVPIIFSCNVDSNSISWYSSLDGKLGEGSGLVKFLSKGNHRIICKIENFEEVIQINVVEKELNSSDTKRDIIFANKQQIFFQKGISLPIFYSFAGSCSNFKFNNISIAEETCHEKTIKVFRDIKIASTITTKKIYKQNIKRSIAQSNSYAVGTEKDFYLIKTDNQLTEPHIISATMIKSTDNCTIWLANNSECDKKLIEQCVKNFEELIFPRLQIIWEKWSDIDNDNKIALLFSPTINKEGTAIGFFNPSDLFAKVSDINSDAYNPYSNQMDIFYLALPVEDKTSSYTINSISATMAHEMTHIFTFYNKTFKQIELGNKNFPQEELFLDEGLSHLCENLCGFGVSGGNIDFIKLFFEDTSKYSF